MELAAAPIDFRPETPLSDDPSFGKAGVTMLPSSGDGENSMKLFMMEHLTFILQPLSETITEVQNSLKRIRDDTAHATSIAERNMEHISAHEQKLILLGAGLSRVNDDITNQRKETAVALEKFVTLEGEVDLTNVSLTKMEAYVKATANAGHDLPQMVDDFDLRIRQAELTVSEMNVFAMAFTDRLHEMRNLHDGLDNRHLQTVVALQELKKSEENTRTVVQRQVATRDSIKKDVERSVTLLEDRLKVAEEMVLESKQKTQETAKGLKAMEEGLQGVLGEVGEVANVQQGLNATTKDRQSPEPAKQDQSPAERFGSRMGKIEESISQINRNAAFEKDAQTKWQKEVDEMINKCVIDMRDKSLNMEAATETAKGNENRSLRNEGRITMAESNIEKVMKLAEKGIEDAQILIQPFRELTYTVDLQKFEIEKVNQHVARVEEEIPPLSEEIEVLNRYVVDMQGVVSKIGMRLELAHEYMQGVSKGVQDTQKRVSAGLDGMMPPKNVTNRKMLPEIPQNAAKAQRALESPSPQ